MRPFTFEAPKLVIDEPGGRRRLGALFQDLGAGRVFIVTDKGVRGAGLLDDVLSALAASDIDVEMYDEVLADPPSSMIEAAVAACREAGGEAVLGIGGGSSLDTAKLVAVMAQSGARLEDIYGVGTYRGGRLPLILVPTTSGTGSEVTPISVVTTPSHEKLVVWSPPLFADVALLDAELTLDLPPAITAATAVDAMTHCIEAFTNVNRKNPVSDALALKGLGLIAGDVRTVVAEGRNLAARRNVLSGAMIAGLAFLNSPVGAVHALAYPLGGHFHVPHGLSNALILPHILRFNAEAGASYYAALAPALLPDPTFASPQAASVAFVEEVEAIIVDIGLERRISRLGVSEADIPVLVEDASRIDRLLLNNPRKIERNDIEAIYRQAF